MTSVLLLMAAGAAAWSTYLHWLPCSGAFFSSSLLRGYRYGPGPGFSDACLHRMDAGGLPLPYPRNPAEQTAWSAELAVVAMLLAGTAWLVLVLGMRWSLRTKAVAVLPALATLALAFASASAAADTSRDAHESISGWLGVAPEGAALLALAAIWYWQPEVQEGCFDRVLLVAWGTTAFGSVHLTLDYVGMTFFTAANWDVPPLTGSVTVLTLTLAAALPAVLALRSSRTPGALWRAGPLTSAGSTPQPPKACALSRREAEVLRLLGSELTWPEIARDLYVSLTTLRTHTERIFTKLDVTSRAAAVRKARDLNLL